MAKHYIALAFIMFLLTGCINNKTEDLPKDEPVKDQKGNDQEGQDSKSIIRNNAQEEKLNQLFAHMSLEEKVAQLFIVDLETLNQSETVTQMTPVLKERLVKYPVGGIIFFAKNIEAVDQTVDLIKGLQEDKSIPLFIAVDEEGGKVSRIANNDNMHATVLPGNATIGKTGDTQYAYEVGKILGKELAVLGFNMDFAPVADVNTNPNNPVIGDRAFGAEPELVGTMVEQMVIGLQEENVSAVLKHFPGHGDTQTDSHKGAVYVQHKIDRLKEIEWVPFIQGIEAGVDVIMTAHIHLPNVITENVPATMSYEMLTGYLRKELGFTGLITTDALNMGAITDHYSSKEAAKKAFLAGADLLLMPDVFTEAYEGILEAVKSGEISEERLNESVKRILEVKMKRGLFEEKIKEQKPKEVLGNKEHLEVVDEIINYIE